MTAAQWQRRRAAAAVARLVRRYRWVVLAVGGAVAVLNLVPPH